MKKLLLSLLALTLTLPAQAQTKFSDFTASTSAASGDFFVGYLAAGGAGSNRRITVANLFGKVPSLLAPATDDGAALGDATHSFSDLFLATGAVMNWGNGNAVITHTSGILTLGTGDFRITTAGTNSTSAVTVGGTQTLTSKTLTSANITTSLLPTTDDGAPLGDATHNFSDLFLATGSLINVANGNWVLTHSSGIETVSTGDLRVTTAGTNTASVVTVGGTQTLTAKTLTSPTMTAPVLGVASATSVNKITLTAPATGSTITIIDGKTFTVNKTITLEGTDGTTMTFPSTSATVARTDAAQTLVGTQTLSSTTSLLLGTAGSAVGNIGFRNGTSGTITLAPVAGALGTVTLSLPAATDTLVGRATTDTLTNKTLTLPIIDGVTSTGATGTGNVVFSAGPTLTGTVTAGTINATALTATSFSAKADVLEASLFAADAGSNDTYVATLSPAITAYVTGAHYRFKAATANTGAATLNLNAVGAKTIKKTGGTADLADNDIQAGQWVDVAYDGTNLQMQSQLGNAASGVSAANPTGTIGLSAVNGSASTFLRSDGAPALSQAIAPTWTAPHTWTPTARSSGVASFFTITTPADTGQTASTESIGFNKTAATRTWAAGALTTQREVLLGAPTIAFASASTVTTAVNVDIPDPIAGTNATLTNAYGLRVNNQKVTGTLTANTGTNLIGPLVDSVDGTTPINNVIQTVASGTAYTMTTNYADVDFGTTDPVVTLANAGTYCIYVTVQSSLVSATTTTQSESFKLRRTNNTPADLTGATFGQPLPVATVGTVLGPTVTIGPIKYTTALTSDTISVQGILSASLGAGTVTITNVTITAVRQY